MNWLETIIFIGFLVVTVGGWINGVAKKTGQRRSRAQWEQQGGSAPPKAPSSTLPSANELAAKRRERLAELAAERRRAKGLGHTTATVSKPKAPQNLSVPDRAAREKAIEQYKQRARQMQAKQPARKGGPRKSGSMTSRPSQAPPVRSVRAAPAPRKVRSTESEHGGRLEDRQLKSSLEGIEKKFDKPVDLHVAEHSTSEVHRRVADTKPVTPVAVEQVGGSLWLGRSLREAIIVKEVLDKPVALREGGGSPGM